MPRNPFTADIFPDGYPVSGADSGVHGRELDLLARMAAEAAENFAGPAAAGNSSASASAESAWGGRVVLLKAPRAGFGKSHLLESLRHRLSAEAYVTLIGYDPERELRWGPLLWQILDSFHQTPLPIHPALTLLDDLSRRIFALINSQMLAEGRVPCANPDAAIAALRTRFLELFDLNDPRQAVGKWFSDHFERLMGTTSAILASHAGLRQDTAAAWLRMLCAYSQGIVDGPAVRFESLRWALHQGTNAAVSAGGMSVTQAPAINESFYKEKLAEFGRIAGLARPMVLVFDHLDIIHGSSDLALRVAGVLAELRRLLPHCLIVLSANQDLWANTFQRFLPSALEDRLSGGLVALGGLNRFEAETLVRSRLHHCGIDVVEGESFLARFNLPELFVRETARLVSPRALLRHAARLWDEMKTEEASGFANVAPLRVEDGPLFDLVSPPPGENGGSYGSHAALHARTPSDFIMGPVGESSHPHPIPTAIPAGPGATSSAEPFDHLKGMLSSLREHRTGASGSPFVPVAPPSKSGVVLRDPISPAPLSRVAVTSAPTDPLLGRFAAVRLRLMQARVLRIDTDRLCHLLEVGGKRLAVVRPATISLPGGYSHGAILWQSPDGEIFFGTEPKEDTAYWQALLQLLREKYQAASATGQPPPRLVIFSAAQEPTRLADWLPAESAIAALSFVDIVTLDQETLSSLYAADELLHEIESGSLAATAEEVITRLSDHLDSFWKRLTRPKRPS